MATLTDQQKAFIVERLACWSTPAQIREELQETFKLDVPASTILRYDPTTVQGEKELGKKWKELFHETRERFLKETAAIPIAHQSYRLQELWRMYRKAGRNSDLGAKLLEQAAREVGGHYTNRRELTGANGGPIQTQGLPPDLSQLTDAELEQWERLLAKTTHTPGDTGGEAPPAR